MYHNHVKSMLILTSCNAVINPCEVDNGGCEFMCLLSSSPDRTHSCICPTGHGLHANGRNCLGEILIELHDFCVVFVSFLFIVVV